MKPCNRQGESHVKAPWCNYNVALSYVRTGVFEATAKSPKVAPQGCFSIFQDRADPGNIRTMFSKNQKSSIGTIRTVFQLSAEAAYPFKSNWEVISESLFDCFRVTLRDDPGVMFESLLRCFNKTSRRTTASRCKVCQCLSFPMTWPFEPFHAWNVTKPKPNWYHPAAILRAPESLLIPSVIWKR